MPVSFRFVMGRSAFRAAKTAPSLSRLGNTMILKRHNREEAVFQSPDMVPLNTMSLSALSTS